MKKSTKKMRLALLMSLAIVSISMLMSCSKSKEKIEVINDKYETVVQEIDLELSFSFERATADNFQIDVSDNFSIEQMSSIYNMDQQIEYFFLNCKNKTNGFNYHIYGIVDAQNKITINWNKGETTSL